MIEFSVRNPNRELTMKHCQNCYATDYLTKFKELYLCEKCIFFLDSVEIEEEEDEDDVEDLLEEMGIDEVS
jgi:hypothetical protein